MCKDNALGYLNDVGYNVIALPREDIDPLLVLAGKPQRLTPIGALTDFFIGQAPVPAMTRDRDAPNISSQRSSRMDATAGLGLTERFLKAMGTSGSIKGEYQSAAHLQITFGKVLNDSVVPQHITNFLDAVEAKPHGRRCDRF